MSNDVRVMVFLDPGFTDFVLVRNLESPDGKKPEGFGFPGGRTKPEEDLKGDEGMKTAAVREVLEETDLEIEVLGEVCWPEERYGHKRHFFLAVAKNKGNPQKIVIEDGVQQTSGWIKIRYVPGYKEEEEEEGIKWPENINAWTENPPTYKSHKNLVYDNRESIDYLIFNLIS